MRPQHCVRPKNRVIQKSGLPVKHINRALVTLLMVSVSFAETFLEIEEDSVTGADQSDTVNEADFASKYRNDLRNPTLGGQSQGQPTSLTFTTFEVQRDPECQRMMDCRAQQKTFNLRKQVGGLKGNYAKNAPKFFVDGQDRGNSLPAAPASAPQKGVTEVTPSVLKVGTDCSGMESPIQAHDNLSQDYTHEFSCDNDPHVVKTIEVNFSPRQIEKDITTRDCSKTPYVDLYIAGFPCQPFSQAGKQQGFEDSKGRGTIFFNVLDYITVQRPKVFLLENVKGLVTMENGKHMRKIIKALRDIKRDGSLCGDVQGESSESAYEIHYEVLNAKDHGIPQSRPRWYCVGILRSSFAGSEKSTFEFPKAIKMPSIELLLDTKSSTPPQKVGNTSRINIEKARAKLVSEGFKPGEDAYIVDCDASIAKSRHTFDFSPCITRSRYQGHWITNRNRRMTKEEMFRLQGMDPTKFVVAIPENALGQQIGNAMSINVVN